MRDYTIPVHGERRDLHHVAIEVRQDLISDDKGQRAWGRLLALLLPHAYQGLVAVEAHSGLRDIHMDHDPRSLGRTRYQSRVTGCRHVPAAPRTVCPSAADAPLQGSELAKSANRRRQR